MNKQTQYLKNMNFVICCRFYRFLKETGNDDVRKVLEGCLTLLGLNSTATLHVPLLLFGGKQR
jgi:hypothetical protein